MSFAASEVISCSIFKMLLHWLHFSSPRAVALFSIKQPQSKCPSTSTLLAKSYHPVVNLALPSVSIRQRCCTHVKMLGPAVNALEEQKNFTSTMGSISVWQMHPFQRPLMSKKTTHSDPEVSSWIIPEQLLQATSCSGSVCVGMFMHEAFIIELWRAQIFWDSIQRDDSSVHVQLPSLHKPGRWRGAQQTAKSNTRGGEQRESGEKPDQKTQVTQFYHNCVMTRALTLNEETPWQVSYTQPSSISDSSKIGRCRLVSMVTASERERMSKNHWSHFALKAVMQSLT